MGLMKRLWDKARRKKPVGFIFGKGIKQLPKFCWQNYYDVEGFIACCVSVVSHNNKRIRPYVARLIQWSWPIEEKLNAIFAQSDQRRRVKIQRKRTMMLSYRQLQPKPRSMWDIFMEGFAREFRKIMNA